MYTMFGVTALPFTMSGMIPSLIIAGFSGTKIYLEHKLVIQCWNNIFK